MTAEQTPTFKVDANISAWRNKGLHLPRFMRDFHGQKALFRTMHDLTIGADKRLDWVAGQCYVIDVFLWFMARHGYTLQKTRAVLPFEDIETNIKNSEDHREALMTAALKEGLNR